jgi:uncharacterized protein (DUF433 family)
MQSDWTKLTVVESNPHILSGEWVFRGTRVPVAALFENLRDGATIDQFLEWFPNVQRTDVRAVLMFTDATNSRAMPKHFFWECLHLDHDSAVRADVSRQNYSVFPRHWYVDATVKCSRCSESFYFTVLEQKRWYEDFGFYVDSFAKDCPKCRRDERTQKALRQEYDRAIEETMNSDGVEAKQRLADIIDELCSFDFALPAKIHENRKILGKQIARLTELKDG